MIISKNNINRRAIDQYLGGQFSLFESFKRGGVGSIKLVYIGGLNEFDKIAERNANTNYCNLQVYKKGLAIIFHKKDEGIVAGINYAEIRSIIFLSIPVKVRYNQKVVTRHQAEIEIQVQECTIKLFVPVINYKPLKLFLTRNIDPSLLDFQEPIP